MFAVVADVDASRVVIANGRRNTAATLHGE